MTLSIKLLFLFTIVPSGQKENLNVLDEKSPAMVWFTFLPVTLLEMQNLTFFVIYHIYCDRFLSWSIVR